MSVGPASPGQPPDGSEPLHDLAVPRAPVRDPGGGRPAGVVATLALVVVIALAVALAQLVPGTEPAPAGPPATPPRPSVAVVATASTEASSGADVTPPRPSVAVPPRLSREALAAAVTDGSLDGRLVFVDGSLRVTPVRCQGPAQGSVGCVDLAIGGLGLPVWVGESVVPWPGEPPSGSWLVTVARAGGLVYLGSLVPSAEGPLPLRQLTRKLLDDELGDPPSTLFEGTGYLVVNPVHTCYRRDPAATPCPTPPPFLAEDEPTADGILRSARGAGVDLVAPVPGVDPAVVVTTGTFLVGLPAAAACRPDHVDPPCTQEGVRWRVIARYEPALAVRVLAP